MNPKTRVEILRSNFGKRTEPLLKFYIEIFKYLYLKDLHIESYWKSNDGQLFVLQLTL